MNGTNFKTTRLGLGRRGLAVKVQIVRYLICASSSPSKTDALGFPTHKILTLQMVAEPTYDRKDLLELSYKLDLEITLPKKLPVHTFHPLYQLSLLPPLPLNNTYGH